MNLFVILGWYFFFLASEFLIYDDDEGAEAADDDVPNAEALLVDNSGWSSRTR